MVPQKPLAGLLWVSMACLPLPLSAQSTVSTTTIKHTQFGEVSDRELAEHWKLTPEEVAHYRQYMRVEGQYFYTHLDPVMVLGLIETDPTRRAHYVGMYLDAERARVKAQTSFAILAATVQQKRFGLEPLVDFSMLPQVAQSPSYRAARAARGTQAAAPPSNPIANKPPSPPPVLQAGDSVDFLIDPSCEAACYDRLKTVLQVSDVKVRLYGRGFKDAAALVGWLEHGPAAQLDAATRARIEPRRFDPLIFSGIDVSHPPVTLLRRNGVVIGRL